MCNEDKNTLLDLDFSQLADESNWLHAITNIVETIDDQLVIDPDSATATFFRQIGNVSGTNNRIRLKCNLEVEKTDPTGPSNMEVLFRLVSGSTILYESCAEFNGLDDGINIAYFLDRTFVYDTPITAPIALMILVPNGWQQKIYLSDLVVEDFTFCQDNVRTYFIIDKLLEDGLIAKSGGVQLLEWKIDGVETLTIDFFADTNIVGGEPLAEWNFAKADLDGSNRISENTLPNSFNPFVNEFKLKFDIANSFHGGKPTGTTNGNDYGAGIMELGLEKPAILNGDLIIKKGAFFIDIDYSKSIKVVFDVIINKKTIDLFVRPDYIRRYTIEWNAATCEKRFYYVEDGIEVDEIVNGFLTGLTGTVISEIIVACDQSFNPTGATGNFSYIIDFGDNIGNCGINYNAYSVPDRFIIEWDGNVVGDSGFVGSNTYDNALINAGVNPADINTASPSNGAGILSFNKTTPYPTTAIISVLAPLGGTGWNVTGICPDGSGGNNGPGVRVQVTKGKCNAVLDGSTLWIDAYIDNVLNIGNGGVLYTDINLTIPFNGGGPLGNFWRIQLTNGLIFNSVYKIDTVGLINNSVSCSIIINPPGGNLTINNSVPNSNGGGFGGTLDFLNGEPNEVLNLSFSILLDSNGGNFTAANFTSPVSVGSLDNIYFFRSGTVSLDSNGNASSNYQISDHNANGMVVIVRITGRSSNVQIPASDSTNITL